MAHGLEGEVIVAVDAVDVRFPTSRELDRSDAMNPEQDYSAAYVDDPYQRRRGRVRARVVQRVGLAIFDDLTSRHRYGDGPLIEADRLYTSGKQLMVHGNKCLDANGQGTSNGTMALIWDCIGQANQQWKSNANGAITGVQSGLCLDASGYGTTNGTKIHLWPCHGGTNQQWTRR